ncbi:hypothetical protein A4A49_51147, partial [Nicotiana attenuata]
LPAFHQIAIAGDSLFAPLLFSLRPSIRAREGMSKLLVNSRRGYRFKHEKEAIDSNTMKLVWSLLISAAASMISTPNFKRSSARLCRGIQHSNRRMTWSTVEDLTLHFVDALSTKVFKALRIYTYSVLKPAHEKIGVVDAQWIVHQGVPSLGNQIMLCMQLGHWEWSKAAQCAQRIGSCVTSSSSPRSLDGSNFADHEYCSLNVSLGFFTVFSLMLN